MHGTYRHKKVSYWQLKNKDLAIHKFAKERVEIFFNEFVESVKKYCDGSYENVYALDQPLKYKSDQRLDFMMNVYQEIIKHARSELKKLENEVRRRPRLE